MRLRAGAEAAGARLDAFLAGPLGFPAFNVADMSITFGVLALLYVLERDDAPARRR